MTTEKLAVHFGAGNIGRGFLAQLYTESGFRVLFVDVLDTVVNALHERGVYPLDIVETDATTRLWIQPVDALHASRADAVTDVLVQADVASTAVGASVLPRLAATLARGIEKRAHLRSGDPLNIILCENLHDAAA
ncbi:MAG TPA: mannitol-1-phosphate 5-dehydrogenase, partial [Candidatus Hydrogenedentes bacterium]|nr:mannitol-1-phosphate 5-dehydrogenase [Candidatus Hydrogenedentota bacterium]